MRELNAPTIARMVPTSLSLVSRIYGLIPVPGARRSELADLQLDTIAARIHGFTGISRTALLRAGLG